MKDNIDEFKKQYISEIPMYEAWGNYVVEFICNKLEINHTKIGSMLKVPAIPRVKELDSIVTKAFYRKKYSDPINDITDKVGVRFVVLLEFQIKLFQNVIQQAEIWTYSKDKDYEDIKKEYPVIFDYQSVHYIVRNKAKLSYNGVVIKADTPCEIQIRTLEQHAYAEISHDYVYKSGKEVDYKIKRNLAKSMALNETTDELFGRVYKMIEEEKYKYTELMLILTKLYSFHDFTVKLNKDIYDSISILLEKHKISGEDIELFIPEYIIENVVQRQDILLFKQPIIFAIYYLVKFHTREFQEIWEFPEDTLDLIYSDLGMSNDY